MAGVIPTGGLGALLGRLLGKPGGGEVEGKASGLKTADGGEGEKPGLAKGSLLGEDGALLAGLGYNPADKRTGLKNVAEKENLARFLQELGREPKEAKPGLEKKEEPATDAKRAEAGAERAEAKEQREQVDKEIRREERAEEAKAQAQHEAKEQRETRESAEAKEQQRQQRDEEDEEDKPGAGWVQEEIEGEEEEGGRRGMRQQDALGDPHRCHGLLEDGHRCLRRPVKGTPYCPEHAAAWRPPRTEPA